MSEIVFSNNYRSLEFQNKGLECKLIGLTALLEGQHTRFL